MHISELGRGQSTALGEHANLTPSIDLNPWPFLLQAMQLAEFMHSSNTCLVQNNDKIDSCLIHTWRAVKIHNSVDMNC